MYLLYIEPWNDSIVNSDEINIEINKRHNQYLIIHHNEYYYLTI